MTLIVAACDKPEAKPPTNIEKDEKADTDTVPKEESAGGNAGKMDGASGNGSSGKTDTGDGETADGADAVPKENGSTGKTDTDGGELADGDAGDTDRYTVTFHMNGHGVQVPQQRNIEHGSTPTPPTEPGSASHKFGGWYTDDTLATKFTFGTDSITKDTDLYAKWTKHVFAFDIEEHKVAFTAGTYTRAVGETNKPAGDARAIEYTSNNEGIATVNDAGVVTFVTQGTVTITATKAAEGRHDEVTDSYILYITMKPATKTELVDEITRATTAHGNEVDLNYIDTSAITNMNYLFASGIAGFNLDAFNGDISKWDVSQVTGMFSMFSGANAFNKDISKWNVAWVFTMANMFWGATSFNQDISGWNVAEVQQDMQSMFRDATSFNKNLDAWGPRIHNAIKTDSWLGAANMFKGSGLANNLPSWCRTTACKDQQ